MAMTEQGEGVMPKKDVFAEQMQKATQEYQTQKDDEREKLLDDLNPPKPDAQGNR